MLRFDNQLPTLVCCAALAVACGCQAPWAPHGNEAQYDATQRQAQPVPPKAPAKASAETPAAKIIPGSSDASIEPATAGLAMVKSAADEATMARVMKEAQAISARDPIAGKVLLEELSRAEPRLWPLVVEQFQSQQAYHDRLAARQAARQAQRAQPMSDFVPDDPPSAEVGKLTDPRGIQPNAELEQKFAAATPAHMPPPTDALSAEQSALIASTTPQPFVEHEPADVIQASTANGNPLREASNVQHAIFETKSAAQAPSEPRHPALIARDWQDYLKLAIDDLSGRLGDGLNSTAEVHQMASLRLLQLLAGSTEDALKPIPNISATEQDYWSGQFFALATFLDHHRQPDDDRRAAASVVHLDTAVGHLRELSTLTLRNLTFCSDVYGYGAYQAIETPKFLPGQQVTLYLEVENYHSESTDKGFKTLLGAGYELLDESGTRIAGGEFPNVEDICQSRRRDFHIQYGLVLPKGLKTGKHCLQLVMKDQQSDKRGSTSIAFDVE